MTKKTNLQWIDTDRGVISKLDVWYLGGTVMTSTDLILNGCLRETVHGPLKKMGTGESVNHVIMGDILPVGWWRFFRYQVKRQEADGEDPSTVGIRQLVYTVWIFPKIGVSQNGWFIMEHPIKFHDLGVPLFLGNTHMLGFCCLPFGRVLSNMVTFENHEQWTHRPLCHGCFISNTPRFNTAGVCDLCRGLQWPIMAFKAFQVVYLQTIHSLASWWMITPGQVIATSHDLTPNGGLLREIPLFQENPGWWNIIIWPDYTHLITAKKDPPNCEGEVDRLGNLGFIFIRSAPIGIM